MTVYEAVMHMNKEKFSRFCYSLYNKGWFDGKKSEDDEDWVRLCMADMDAKECDCIDLCCD